MELTRFHTFTEMLTRTLLADDRVLALVAIGSLAHAERIDAWSDHDFWVITTTEAQQDLLTDLSWLPDHTSIIIALRPAEQYYTVLYATGHVAEFAVFGLHDLTCGRLTHYCMLFDKNQIAPHVQAIAMRIQQEYQHSASVSATLEYFLMTLCTGAGRAARGEWLSAHTYIFQYAVDALLKHSTQRIPSQRADLVDMFDSRRRFEWMYPELSTTLAALVKLPPITAARHLLDLAEQLFANDPIALSPQAVLATRTYLQKLEREQL